MFGPLRKINPRLGQWDGRKHSSRGDEPMLPRLWDRPVLIRLAVVAATTLIVTAMAFFWGPPLPYRVGECYPFDLRVRVDFELVNQVELAARAEAQRNRVVWEQRGSKPEELPPVPPRPVVEPYPKGMLLLQFGQPVTEPKLVLLEEEHEAYQKSMKTRDYVRRGIGLFLMFSLLSSVVVLYVARFQKGLAQSLPTIISVCILVLITVGLGMALSLAPWQAAIIPLTFTAMVFTIVYNPQFALLMSFSLCLGMSIILGTDLGHLLEQMGGLGAAVLLLRNVRTRTRLVKVALSAGTAYVLMTIATGLITRQTVALILSDSVRHFLWGTLAGFLLSGCLPLVERCFGIVTDISLLELADGSHPLLQELVRRAPGTYTHSITVATIAETAAEEIAANPLLTRVGSYFHDVGKMLKPDYFVENQNGQNRHDGLEPALSTLIIIGHVKDGVALAREYGLPQPIVDFVQQHHGTTLVEYFYREALRISERDGSGQCPLEPSFRYPGPKPRSRETGIVMLADAVESSSRALGEPTPSSLRKLVHDLLMKRLLDGQFEESGLTLTELHQIEESLSKSMIALFHARIKYPEPKLDSKAA